MGAAGSSEEHAITPKSHAVTSTGAKGPNLLTNRRTGDPRSKISPPLEFFRRGFKFECDPQSDSCFYGICRNFLEGDDRVGHCYSTIISIGSD